MTQSFFIPGPLPGMNDYAGKKSRWHYKKLKEDWGATIGLYINRAKLQPIQRAAVRFEWLEKNKRRDPDNIMSGAKFVMDALVAAKVLPDDGWAEVASIEHFFTVNSQAPGVVVTLGALTPCN